MSNDLLTAHLLDVEGKSAGEIHLPQVFQTSLRLDIIQRAAIAQQSHAFQPQGRNLTAGKRTNAEGFGVGRGISGEPRIEEDGPLIVVGDDRNARKALRNFEGVEVIRARDLSVEALAPGTHPGRLTIWSESAIKTVAERKW